MAEPEDMSTALAEEILAELRNFRATMNQGFDKLHKRLDNISESMDTIDGMLERTTTRFKNPESNLTP